MIRRSFRGATVLISGAASGLGRALALRFAREGSRLALLDLDAAALGGVQLELDAQRAECLTIAGDVTDPDACDRAVRAACERFGRLDVLVNNAGITHRSAFARTDPSVLRRVLEVNFFGALQLTHAALPPLLEARGSIIVISSVAGFSPLVARTGYAASKHALHGFFGSLRTELADDGVGVTIACPSFIATNIDRHAMGGDGGPARHAQVVVGRRLSPEAVAERILRGAARDRRLLLIGATAHLAWWLSRVAPGMYERGMARRLRGEMREP